MPPTLRACWSEICEKDEGERGEQNRSQCTQQVSLRYEPSIGEKQQRDEQKKKPPDRSIACATVKLSNGVTLSGSSVDSPGRIPAPATHPTANGFKTAIPVTLEKLLLRASTCAPERYYDAESGRRAESPQHAVAPIREARGAPFRPVS